VIASSLLLHQSEVEALEVAFPLEDAQAISDGEGTSRILLGFGEMSQLRDERVTSAYVNLPLPNRVPEEEFDVIAYGLATPWRGMEPTWTSPWTTPGGDVDESASSSIVTLDEGQAALLLRLDVAHLVRAVLAGDVAANGFILTSPRGGFSDSQMNVLGRFALGSWS